jgi:hypothetical protein
VCDQSGPEDLAIVPGGQWVMSSGLQGNGAIRLNSVRDSSATVLFPSPSSKTRPDTSTYKSCPGPLDAAGQKAMKTLGLYLRPGARSVHKVFVVNHGSRESIEVFELDASAVSPTLTWIGCAVAPDPIGLNAVVGLPDGGFIATNFHSRIDEAAELKKMRAGEKTGEVWEWHPASGWKIVPGSEDSGPNGLEISKDGKWLYVGGWGKQSLVRLSRGVTPVKRDAVVVGFHIDNVRWAPDGTLFAAGQGEQTSNVAKVNPDTLKSEEIIRHRDDDAFRIGTTAVQVGNEIWLGSVFGDRIPRVPVARLSSW